MGSIILDIRYALRMLAKSPGFTAVAVLSLTLGIGANTTIFTLAKAIFLQSIPIKDPGRVVTLYSTAQSTNGPLQQYLQTPYPNALDYRDKTDVFSGVVIAFPTGSNLNISGKEVRVFTQLVSANYFDVLGVRPVIGRGFSSDMDETPQPVAVLSYALWSRQFGADPKIIGRTIQLDQQVFTVIGVAPSDFHNIGDLGSPNVWIPLSLHDQFLTGTMKSLFNDRGFRATNMEARLKPGVTFAQAQTAVHDLGLQLQKEFPKDNGGRNEMLVPITETSIPPQLHSIFALAGALMMSIVGLVLLIACANVANLLLARASQRQREIAVRLTMGASRNRLIRQLLTESLLLGVIAAAFGILCAYWARPLILSLIPGGLPRGLDFSLDVRVLAYTLLLAIVATVLFGLVPALQASRPDSIARLKDRTAAPTGSGKWYGLRGVLVMIQVALSLVALVGAGLFIHSLRNAQKIDPGFDVQHTVQMFVNLGAEHYDQARAEQFYQNVIERLRTLPMVAGAALTDTPPLEGGLERTTFPDGVDTSDPRNGKLTPVIAVSSGYFAASEISLLRGRDFTPQDDSHVALVGIVNRVMAERTWPGESPLGKHLHFLGETWDVTVVGEVNTVKYATLGEPPQPIVYFPLKQRYSPFAFIQIRTRGNPGAALPTLRGAVAAVAPDLPLTQVLTMPQIIDQSLAAPRMGAELLGGFGLLALVLAAIGTYGVMSYSVTQRTQEIGIRIALGAQPGKVLRLILSGGMAMVLSGIVAGFLLSTLLTRSMSSLLYGIGSFDPESFLTTAALLILVALMACWIPARRAARVDPMVALRYE